MSKKILKYCKTNNYKLKKINDIFYLFENNNILAWASNLEDLEIMLFLKRDFRQDDDGYYWFKNKKWGYNPFFLNQLLKDKTNMEV